MQFADMSALGLGFGPGSGPGYRVRDSRVSRVRDRSSIRITARC